MGFLLVIAVAFVATEDFIELEPVQAALTQTCSIYNGLGRTACHASPSCYYTISDDKCQTDPCYKWISEEAAGNDCGASSLTSLACIVKSYTTYTSDCATTPPTVKTNKYCSGQDNEPATMTDCEYEYLKSNKTKCPSYTCQVSGVGVGGVFEICDAVTPGLNGCPSNLVCECLTEDYCALNPYCYVNNHTCIADTCTSHFEENGDTCAQFNDIHAAIPNVYGAVNDPCVKFDVYDGSAGHANGDTVPMCVNSKRNKTPNKCYELWNGFTYTGSGECRVYTLPSCAENTECVAQTNTSGPYKDYYCGDATHTASSVLVHAPAMVIIALAVLAFLL